MIALDICQFTEDHAPAELCQLKNELSDTNQDVRGFLMQDHGDDLKLFLLGKLRSPVEGIEERNKQTKMSKVNLMRGLG